MKFPQSREVDRPLRRAFYFHLGTAGVCLLTRVAHLVHTRGKLGIHRHLGVTRRGQQA